MDIKGTGWVVRGNSGTNTLQDGFQTHDQPGFNSGEQQLCTAACGVQGRACGYMDGGEPCRLLPTPPKGSLGAASGAT